METKEKKWKSYTPEEYRKLGNDNVKGCVVEFEEPLYCYGYEKPKKLENGHMAVNLIPRMRTKEPVAKFMVVTGGFGSSFNTMGRMLTGEFYQSLEDVDNEQPIGYDDEEFDWGKNTKEPFFKVWVRE